MNLNIQLRKKNEKLSSHSTRIVHYIYNARCLPAASRGANPSEDGYLPGVQFQVHLYVHSLDQDYEFIETPPQGWTIGSQKTLNGTISDGSINGQLRERLYQNPRTLTYLVTPPKDWQGEGIFTGKFGEYEIGGMKAINKGVKKPVGIFEHHTDLCVVPYGDAIYNAQEIEYRIVEALGQLGGLLQVISLIQKSVVHIASKQKYE